MTPHRIFPLSRSRLSLLFSLCFGCVGTVWAEVGPPARHLFLNPAILTATDGAVLKVNPAQRRETVIFPDRPWEKHMISFFLTVRDEGGTSRPLPSQLLGERILMKSLAIANCTNRATSLDSAAGEPMSAVPLTA